MSSALAMFLNANPPRDPVVADSIAKSQVVLAEHAALVKEVAAVERALQMRKTRK